MRAKPKKPGRRAGADVVVMTRVPREVAKFIRRSAAAEGLSRSAWLRQRLMRAAKGE